MLFSIFQSRSFPFFEWQGCLFLFPLLCSSLSFNPGRFLFLSGKVVCFCSDLFSHLTLFFFLPPPPPLSPVRLLPCSSSSSSLFYLLSLYHPPTKPKMCMHVYVSFNSLLIYSLSFILLFLPPSLSPPPAAQRHRQSSLSCTCPRAPPLPPSFYHHVFSTLFTRPAAQTCCHSSPPSLPRRCPATRDDPLSSSP